MERTVFNRRLRWVVCGFAALLLAAMAAHIRLAGPAREQTLTDAGFAVETRLFYPARACILDSRGEILAWTERRFDLVWRGRDAIPQNLKTTIAGITGCAIGDAGVLHRDLRPDQIMQLERIVSRYADLAVIPRLERLTAGPPELRQMIGDVTVQDGVMRGVSGLEAEYDRVLVGKPGQYRVIRDQNGKWIRGTWQMLTDPIPATDVRTALILPEVRQ